MKPENVGTIWWELPGQSSSVKSQLTGLLPESSLILHTEDRLPWQDTLYRLLGEHCDRPVHMLNWTGREESAGDFLLKSLFTPRQRAMYFPDVSYGEYIASLPMEPCLIRVRGVHTQAQLGDWTDFLQDYHNAESPMSFIVEYDGPRTTVPVPLIRHRVDDHQCRSFSLLLSDVLNNCGLVSYQAELALHISQGDPELCSLLLALGEELLSRPVETTLALRRQYPALDEPRVTSAAHQATLVHLFPRIEACRLSFIRRHLKELTASLPIRSLGGAVIDNPYELEIGQLSYLIRHNDLLCSLESAELIHLCAHVRNQIAHNKPIAYETLCVLTKFPLAA